MVLPEPEHREDMGRHVQGVWRGGRDRSVASCGWEPPLCEWREVIGMNDIVGDARVIGLLDEYFLQERPGLQLPGVGFVGMIDRLVQRQRIEDRRLRIIGIVLVELFHSALVGLNSRLIAALIGLLEISLHRPDVPLLARRLGACCLGLLHSFPSSRQSRTIQGQDQWVRALAHRQTPVAHGTGRVRFGDRGECLDGLWKKERMQ